MSCCGESSEGGERVAGTGCCGSSCAGGKGGCPASEPRIRSCMCQENVGCLDRADCGGFRPRGTAATGACPGPCQCAEEDAWNRNIPPKPNCEWLSNFSELRRQWSDHARKNKCKCCSCAPIKKAAPCKPCLPPVQSCGFSMKIQSPRCDDRLAGGACGSSSGCGSSRNHYENSQPPSNSCQPCAPSPKPILKNRSCCQCVSGGCMCQPMSRSCKCPPPVQVDVRADNECSCECPSSPECACPPSERRFSRTKTKCPNAKLCHTPRSRPGPKCDCTKCQPCLPPPCDPCTITKCRPAIPRVPPCIQENSYESLSSQNSCRSGPSGCKKTQFLQTRCETSDSSEFYTPCRGSELTSFGESDNHKSHRKRRSWREKNQNQRRKKEECKSYQCPTCQSFVYQIPNWCSKPKEVRVSFRLRPDGKNVVPCKKTSDHNCFPGENVNCHVSFESASNLRYCENLEESSNPECSCEIPSEQPCDEMEKLELLNPSKSSINILSKIEETASSSSTESINCTLNCTIDLGESSSSSICSNCNDDRETISTMDIHCSPFVSSHP